MEEIVLNIEADRGLMPDPPEEGGEQGLEQGDMVIVVEGPVKEVDERPLGDERDVVVTEQTIRIIPVRED